MATETEELQLRKLKAETELAEQQLARSRLIWKSCGHCGGSGVFMKYFDRDAYAHRSVLTRCGSCNGKGGHYFDDQGFQLIG